MRGENAAWPVAIVQEVLAALAGMTSRQNNRKIQDILGNICSPCGFKAIFKNNNIKIHLF
jgi:hypothetical protein